MKRLNESKIRLLVAFVLSLMLINGSAKADFTFGEPIHLDPPLSSSAGDGIGCVSYDGLEMYLDRNSGGYGGWDIWVATRETVDDDWGAPMNLGPTINTSQGDACAYISANGLELYFGSFNREGGIGGWDVRTTTRTTKHDPWGQPNNLGPVVNSSAIDGAPSISSNGLELYFMSNRFGGYGSHDIWVSRRATVNDPWGPPENPGQMVNSSASESFPYISPDGLCLFFSEEINSPLRPGGYGNIDMWITRRVSISEPWGTPVNLGPIVNSSSLDCGPRISPDGSILYFCSERPGGLGGQYGDNYQAPIIPIVDFNGDEIVDLADLLILIDNWGTSESLCDIGPTPLGDGIVDVKDLEVLMSYWGQEWKVYDPTLVARWKLDETEGDIAYDSARDFDGRLIGGPVWQPTAGKVNGALQLDGVDDYVSTPFVLSPAQGAFSVFAWVKGGAPGQAVISQDDGMNWVMLDAANGVLMTELRYMRGRAAEPPLLSQTLIADGVWHRIGFVWDGSNRKLYVDGVEVARDTQTGLEGSTGGLYIGAGKGLESASFWSGLIDDVRIYNRAVTP